MTNCSRCKREKSRDLCPCCDLPRRGSFTKLSICEHRPEFDDFVAYCNEIDTTMSYMTWWNTVRKPKQRIVVAENSYDPFRGVKTGKKPEELPKVVAAIEPVEVPIAPIVAAPIEIEVVTEISMPAVEPFIPFALLPPHIPEATILPILPILSIPTISEVPEEVAA
jgi:hypothetical protein